MAATFFHSLFEFQEVAIEVVERFPFDFMAALPRRFPVGKAGAASIVGVAVLINAAADDLAMCEVRGFFDGAAEEFLRGGTHWAVTVSFAPGKRGTRDLSSWGVAQLIGECIFTRSAQIVAKEGNSP